MEHIKNTGGRSTWNARFFLCGCSDGLSLLGGVCLSSASAASGLGLSLKEIRSGWFSGVGAILFCGFGLRRVVCFGLWMLCGGGGAVKWRLCILEKGLRFWSAFPQKGDRRMIPIKARESLFGCPGASRVCGAGRSIGSAGCVSGGVGWRMWGFVGCGGFLCFSGLARRFRFTGGFFAREMGSGAAVF